MLISAKVPSMATIAGKATPVLCGTALRNKGVQRVLDAVVHYLPSPLDVPPMQGVNPYTGNTEERSANDDEPLSALVFKIVTDPYVGRLAYFRVYSGVMKSGDSVLNSSRDKKERIGRILQMHSNDRKEIKEVCAGDIAAAVGLKETYTGDTLTDIEHPVILESMTFPEPVIEVAIEPKTKADQDKMANALARLSEEDPTFRLDRDAQTVRGGNLCGDRRNPGRRHRIRRVEPRSQAAINRRLPQVAGEPWPPHGRVVLATTMCISTKDRL